MARCLAVLGPTNTGKTHFALERMLGHASGMIGFPLRLLARENYERVVKVKGEGAVALITGEERIVPAHPRYFVCTAESMPLDRAVAFLAVDEIQLCADPERGHIFTDRLLHARGTEETLFLGAETIRPLIRRLVPGVEFVTRPRFSQLTYAGPRKLTRLPPRSAVVAFSAAEVYGLAEFIRRQRGGAAVVLGALSPRTRNAQVGLYQAGEVDYIVATDAIGMGLNMDVDHVAFAALRKFDGINPRDLAAAELAQIAGRAGRHMNDGTFGTTGDAGAIAPDMVEAVENHHFPALKALCWRNSDLRFTSLQALAASLDRAPPSPGLVRGREADDRQALTALSADSTIAPLVTHPDRVRLLWEVCQIPDFRKVMADSHARLLASIFRHLAGPSGRLPTDWLARQIARLDRTDGEFDTLIARIANVRTWTYVSHRGDWVEDGGHWQGLTRAIEDRLSDALHERLTQRFVDRRTAILVRSLRDATPPQSEVAETGAVLVAGQKVGRLAGFRFHPEATEGGHAARAVAAAADRALKAEIGGRIEAFTRDSDQSFALAADGAVLWRGDKVADLAAGPDILRPAAILAGGDLLDGGGREKVRRRLERAVAAAISAALAPLFTAQAAPLAGAARGLIHHLAEGLGSVPRSTAGAQIRALSPEDRAALARLDIRLGVESVYLPMLLKPAAQEMRALLWRVHDGRPAPAAPGARTKLPVDPEAAPAFYEAVGYRILGNRAIRVDMLERLAAEIRRLAREAGAEGFAVTPRLLSLLALPAAELVPVLSGLGYRPVEQDGVPRFRPAPRRDRPRRRDKPSDSPFAVLLNR